MQFTVLDMAGKTLFTRDDAERALWTVEEMSLDMLFPYIGGKSISIGQRILFTDPATGRQEIHEVKQSKTYQPDAYQEVTAEHICISELSDEHMDSSEITEQNCSSTLSGVLAGTLWSVGNVEINPVSSVNLSRGSVWQAVLQIKENYNVYIEPRVILNADGSITRYLDIRKTDGTWNGVRLSIDKNIIDPAVIYDDSEIATALYGYGGTLPTSDPNEEAKECDFADVVWTATDQHPAKPQGQTYLEDPTATALYGRDGRARFGYFQNYDITDPNILLEMTWKTLQNVSKPSISIEGTVADLYRMGYADQPIRLHDIALVEVQPAGFKKQIQIIKLTVDFVDPSATRVTIGSYIPNIIYISRDTNEQITGSRGGGGGNSSKTETKWREFETTMQFYKDGTGMQIQAVRKSLDDTNQEVIKQAARIEVTYNKITQEVTDRRNADNELAGRITVEANRITEEVTQRKHGQDTLEGRLTIEANRITQEVINRENSDNVLSGRITTEANKISLVVTEHEGENVVNSASIVAGINSQSGSYVKIDASKINLNGYVTTSMLESAFTSAQQISTQQMTISQYFTCLGYNVEWKTYTARHCSLSGEYYFNDYLGTQHKGRLVTGYTDTTIYYLGR